MRYYIQNEKFVSLTPGDAIRVFPFAKLTRGGKTIDFDRALAEQVKLPNYKPAIKLGSHDDATPAGGSIASLFVGEDGLYAVPEYTDKGRKALEDGDYRYFSPEIYWDGELEDVLTGSIEAPVLTGLALLHDPALGGAAALYQTEKESDMTDAVIEELSEQRNLLEQLPEKFAAAFAAFREGDGDKPDPDEYAATQKERDEFKAQLEEYKAEQEAEKMRAAIRSEFQGDEAEEFGAAYIELGEADDTVEVLASMTEEQREWTLKNLRALSAQVDESTLTGEEGAAGDEDGATGLDAVDKAIKAYAAEHKVSYNEAFAAVRKENPDIFNTEAE